MAILSTIENPVASIAYLSGFPVYKISDYHMNLRKISHYEIIERLGEGGMGVVYKARDSINQNIVAIKVLSDQALSNHEIKRRFQREAAAGLRLVHPNIVRIMEVGEEEGTYFICMEYIQGQTLRQLMQDDGPLESPKVIQIGIEVNKALGNAHALGIIHRDIKSDNIMLTPAGEVKVMDFGLAKFQDASLLTKEGEVLGTISYMSPQQVMGETIDARSDLFSLGVVLYELLSGQLPFTGDYEMAVLYAIVNEKPVDLIELNANITPALSEVIAKSLSKEPAKRYQDTESFSDDLKRVEVILEGFSETSVIAPVTTRSEQVYQTEKSGYLSLASRKGFQARLSGRDVEFDNLKNLLELAKTSNGQTIFISGEAGIGKSRLVTELQKYARTYKIRTLTGQCQCSDHANPYQPFIDIICQYFDMMGAFNKESLDKHFKTNLPDLTSLIPLIHVFLDLSESHLIETKEQIWDALYRLLMGIARDKPYIIFFDDLHWSDVDTRNLLDYTVRNLKRSKILIIATYRPEDVAPSAHDQKSNLLEIQNSLQRQKNFTHIELKRLDESSLQKMVNSLFQDSIFNEDFYRILYKDTEGNPFFIIETLKLLRSEGTIEKYNGGYRLRDEYEQISIPGKVQDIVLRRIDNLVGDEREVLEIGAVEGTYFYSDTINNCLDINRIKLLKILQHLEREHHLIFASDKHYCFDHSKIQEILYEAITPELRSAYHAMIGDYLAKTKGEDDLLAPGIANHFLQGKKNEQALPFLLRAGKRAKAIFANEQSIELYQKALKIIEEGEISALDPKLANEKFTIVEDLGDALFVTGQFDQALEKYNLILTFDNIPLLKQVNLFWKSSLVHINKGKHDDAMVSLNRAETKYLESIQFFSNGKSESQTYATHFDEGELVTALGKIKISRAQIYKANGNYPEAIKEIEEGLSILGEKGFLKDRSQAYNNLGNIFFDLGKYEQSAQMHNKSLFLREQIADKKGIAETYNNLSNVYYEQGNYHKSAEMCEKSLAMMEEIGYRNGIAGSYNNLATIYQDLGRYHEAYDAYQNSLFIWREIGDKPDLAIVYANLGSACIDLGKWNEAKEYLQKSIVLYEEIGLKYFMPQALVWYCQVLLEKKQFQKALNQATKALKIAEDHQQRANEGLVKRMRSMIELSIWEKDQKNQNDLKKPAHIETMLNKSLEIFQELGMHHEAGRSHLILGNYYLVTKQSEKARWNLQKAISIFKQLGAIGDLKKAERLSTDIN